MVDLCFCTYTLCRKTLSDFNCMQTTIPYMQIRGGSSKGLYFLASDLPVEQHLKDQILLAAMCGFGADDIRQIDGLGGADPLTSKVGIVSRSIHHNADLANRCRMHRRFLSRMAR